MMPAFRTVSTLLPANRVLRPLLLLLVLAYTVTPAQACSIPVFRYALERWEASPYELLVYHRGPLPAEQQAALRRLKSAETTANLVVRSIDFADKVDEEHQALWDRHARDKPLPWLLARYPDAGAKVAPAWAGPLTERNVHSLLASPTRQRVLERLGKGDSAVFILLTGGDAGDPRADDAAAELLRRELPRLQRDSKLPEPSSEGPQLLTTLPLHVSFTVVRLNRDDAAEAAFVALLLGSEPRLHEVKGPIVFPVFGRGRLLCAVQGKRLNTRELEDIAVFLCSACSCRVKQLNPGVDLLLSADWEKLLPPQAAPPARTTLPPPPPEGSVAARGLTGLIQPVLPHLPERLPPELLPPPLELDAPGDGIRLPPPRRGINDDR